MPASFQLFCRNLNRNEQSKVLVDIEPDWATWNPIWIFEQKLRANVSVWWEVWAVEWLSVLAGGLRSWESFRGEGRETEREKWKEREERRGGQDESEVIMCLDPQADSCHFCLLGTPLHFNSVFFSVRDHTTPVPYRLGITDQWSPLASCSLSRGSRQKKVVLSFWWLSSRENVGSRCRIPGAALIPAPPASDHSTNPWILGSRVYVACNSVSYSFLVLARVHLEAL